MRLRIDLKLLGATPKNKKHYPTPERIVSCKPYSNKSPFSLATTTGIIPSAWKIISFSA